RASSATPQIWVSVTAMASQRPSTVGGVCGSPRWPQQTRSPSAVSTHVRRVATWKRDTPAKSTAVQPSILGAPSGTASPLRFRPWQNADLVGDADRVGAQAHGGHGGSGARERERLRRRRVPRNPAPAAELAVLDNTRATFIEAERRHSRLQAQ